MIAALDELEPSYDPDASFIADNAMVIGGVTLGNGTSVWFGSVLRADNDRIDIGCNSNIQDACVLHTDPGIALVIGREVTVGHRATLHGCTIGDGTLIGIGSTILNHANIGSECLVGAHSLITEGKTFPDGVLIHGTPADVVRELSAEERKGVRAAASAYVEKARRYRATFRPADVDRKA